MPRPRRPAFLGTIVRDDLSGEPVCHWFGPAGEISMGAESIRLTIPPEIIIICGSKGFLAAKFISVMIGWRRTNGGALQGDREVWSYAHHYRQTTGIRSSRAARRHFKTTVRLARLL